MQKSKYRAKRIKYRLERQDVQGEGVGKRGAHCLENLGVNHVIGPEGNAGADNQSAEEPDAQWHA